MTGNLINAGCCSAGNEVETTKNKRKREGQEKKRGKKSSVLRTNQRLRIEPATPAWFYEAGLANYLETCL